MTEAPAETVCLALAPQGCNSGGDVYAWNRDSLHRTGRQALSSRATTCLFRTSGILSQDEMALQHGCDRESSSDAPSKACHGLTLAAAACRLLLPIWNTQLPRACCRQHTGGCGGAADIHSPACHNQPSTARHRSTPVLKSCTRDLGSANHQKHVTASTFQFIV